MTEYKASPAAVLGLAADEVETVEEMTTGWRLAVRCPRPTTCPACGGTRWHRHGRLPARVVAHTWVGETPVQVTWTPQRYRCVACHHVTQARPLQLAAWQRWSAAAQTAALRRLRRDRFRGVATVLGVGVGRWRRLVDRVVALEDDTWWDLPGDLVLSLDEAAFRGTDRCIPIALRAPERRVLTIRADDRLATRDAWFARIPAAGRARIRGGGIDMKVAYAKALRRACPHVAVLVDPFPLIQDGTARVDAARRLEQTLTQHPIRRWPLIKGVEHLRPRQQEALAQIQTTYPALGPRHRLKEDWRTLLHAPDLPTATTQLNRWLLHAEACDDAEGDPWAQTLRRWRPALWARWPLGQRFTNGYIEGCHTKMKSQKRQSYGFRNRDRYRRKMLLGFRPPIQIPQGLT